MFWSFLSVAFVFPFCCVLRLFSHQLERADPSSYEAYPRVVEPAPRPSEGPGSAVVRARFFVWERVTGTPGTIFGGEGARTSPSGPFFTRTFLSSPSFFCFCCPSGLVESLKRHVNLESARRLRIPQVICLDFYC